MRTAAIGVGLSLLRVHIRPCDTVNPCQPTTDEIGTAKAAAKPDKTARAAAMPLELAAIARDDQK